MRTPVLAAHTTAICLAGCVLQPSEQWDVSTQLLDESGSDLNPEATHLLSFYTSGNGSISRKAMIAVSETCSSSTLLSEDEVDMNFESSIAYLVEEGPELAEVNYTFRCPEPGKEIQ